MTLSAAKVAEVTVLLVSYVAAFHNLDYSDLQTLGVSCPPHDNCDVASDTNFSSPNCNCDSRCYQYGDCCINAPRYSGVFPIRGLQCFLDSSSNRGVYVVGSCSRSWAGSMEVRQKCERSNGKRDPVMAAPATDVINNITYKNRYCSECNYVNSSSLRSWSITVECNSLLDVNATGNVTEDYVKDHLTYKTTYPHRNRWGVYLWDGDFHPCRLVFSLPGYLDDHVRLCTPNLVSTCTPTWRRSVIRQSCRSYTSVVVAEDRAFKNPHCAICNNVDLSTLRCPLTLHSRRKPPLSFTLLLDVNLNDGNKVGEINRCPEGRKYDTFFKKCRNLVCALPGYELEGETCVKSS